MARSLVVHKGVPVLVAGGVGGPTIIGGAAAAFLNVVDFRQDVAPAIDASDPIRAALPRARAVRRGPISASSSPSSSP